MGKTIGLGLATCALLATLGAGGCKKWEDKMDTQRNAYQTSAGACPAPATCTDKRRGDGGRDYKVCAGLPATATYAPGDVVMMHEFGEDQVAALKEKKAGDDFGVTFADGILITRNKSKIVARVCN